MRRGYKRDLRLYLCAGNGYVNMYRNNLNFISKEILSWKDVKKDMMWAKHCISEMILADVSGSMLWKQHGVER